MLLGEVLKLLKIVFDLTFPVASSTSKCIFSALLRLKTHLIRCTMDRLLFSEQLPPLAISLLQT